MACDGSNLFVSDTSNNRVMIFNSIPSASQPSANWEVGQVDFSSNALNQDGGNTFQNLESPGDIYYDGNKLFVADTVDSRIQVYNSIPVTNFAASDYTVGGGGAVNGSDMLDPEGVFSDGATLFVADTGNNRVMVYDPLPTSSGGAANFVIGQTALTNGTANQGGAPTSQTLNSPYSVFQAGSKLFVADGGNNRVLIYNSLPTNFNAGADVVIGQPNMGSTQINQGGAPTSQTLHTPANVYSNGAKLFIADASNNRVLIYNSIPVTNNTPADLVVGQVDMATTLVNQGGAPTSQTLSTPTGLWSDGSRLFIVDEGNHRVLIYNSIPTANNMRADSSLGSAGFPKRQRQSRRPVSSALTMGFPSGHRRVGK